MLDVSAFVVIAVAIEFISYFYISFAISFSIIAPDIILNKEYFLKKKSRARRYLVSTMFFSIPIVLSGFGSPAIALLVLLFIIVAVWHLNYLYFGEALGPDSISLLVKPDHFRDVISVAFDDIVSFLPTLSLVAACLGSAIYLLSLAPEHDFQPLFGVVSWLVLILTGVRIAFRPRVRHEYPEANMAGVFGGLHALVLAIKWSFTPVKELSGAVRYTVQPANDALILVLMGESINPARMGLFSGLDTTPKIDAILSGAWPFKGVAKAGFSSAVASNASVVGFLSGTPFPWRTEESRSLFDLARSQGFETRYWSGQTRSPIDALGDAELVNDVFSFESAMEDFRTRKDWYLLDKLEQKPFGKRELAFLYPRCNHSPYHCHDAAESGKSAKPPSGNVIENYDAGMRVFDAFVADLLERVQTRDRRVFVFITSDHNELLGDREGLRGHALTGHAAGALVPYLLLTNDPESDVFKEFSSPATPTAWSVAELVMRIMGVTASVEPALEGCYIGNSLPYNNAGHMKVSDGEDDVFSVEDYDRTGTFRARSIFLKASWLNAYRRSDNEIRETRLHAIGE